MNYDGWIRGFRGGMIPDGTLGTGMGTSLIDYINADYLKRAFDMGEKIRWFDTHTTGGSFRQPMNFNIKKVIFNDPATIILWQDGTKTVVKCQEGDTYSKELGLAMCISKKALGNKSNFNNVFTEWLYE